MSKEMATQVVVELKGQFKKSFPEAGMKLVWSDLVAAQDMALAGAFDYFVLNNRFPSPQQLKDQVAIETKKLAAEQSARREKEWEAKKEKRNDPDHLKIAARDEHAKFALQGIALMRRTDKTREEKLDFFRMMDDRYPGVGWGIEGARLKGFWEEGKPLTPAGC